LFCPDGSVVILGSIRMPGLPRIVSFLPSATEMACALGLSDQLVGVTHECDYPPSVREKPVVVSSAISMATMTQVEIDRIVSERMRNGQSLYQVDEKLLQELAPDLILTQDLCQVCAPSGNEVTQALSALPTKPEILWLTPKSLAEIAENLRALGAATGRLERAEELIARGRVILERVAERTRMASTRPRVFCMEWLDPVYCSGHWVPEMVSIAGGVDHLGREGSDSVRVAWEDVLACKPEVLVIMPCGFNLHQVLELTPELCDRPGWHELPAVQQGRVYAVDASSYFARPGPRVVEGTELLAHIIHPDLFSWTGAADAYSRLDL
jgi:iron complex transport system substrate-binding protein